MKVRTYILSPTATLLSARKVIITGDIVSRAHILTQLKCLPCFSRTRYSQTATLWSKNVGHGGKSKKSPAPSKAIDGLSGTFFNAADPLVEMRIGKYPACVPRHLFEDGADLVEALFFHVALLTLHRWDPRIVFLVEMSVLIADVSGSQSCVEGREISDPSRRCRSLESPEDTEADWGRQHLLNVEGPSIDSAKIDSRVFGTHCNAQLRFFGGYLSTAYNFLRAGRPYCSIAYAGTGRRDGHVRQPQIEFFCYAVYTRVGRRYLRPLGFSLVRRPSPPPVRHGPPYYPEPLV